MEDQVAIEVAPPPEPTSATWDQTWRNVGFPALFGVAVGVVWQEVAMPALPTLPYGFPNPVQAALLVYLLLTPLVHRVLTEAEPSRWNEYALGCSSLVMPLVIIWTMGYGGLVCGGYLASVVWVWISTSWWRFRLPPFRLALWHTLGVNIGALGGSILTYNLLA